MESTDNTTQKVRTFTLDLTDGGGKKAYLAKITGSHPVYKLQREFVEKISQDGRHRVFRFSEDGIYEQVEYSAKGNKHQRFFRFENGESTDLTAEEVQQIFNAPEKGQAPARRSSCACTDGCCDNGCHCGSECNCNGGPIWNC